MLIVEGDSGSVLGTIERERAYSAAHEGAVYLHLGESYLVRRLDLKEQLVLVGEHSSLLYPFRFERFESGDLHPVSNSPYPWS